MERLWRRSNGGLTQSAQSLQHMGRPFILLFWYSNKPGVLQNEEAPASPHQRFERLDHGSFTRYLHLSLAVLHLEAEHNKVGCF